MAPISPAELLILMITAFTAACGLVTTIAQLIFLALKKGRDD